MRLSTWRVAGERIYDAIANGWPNRRRKSELAQAKLTLSTLADRLDNMGRSTLHQELRKLGAPTPGALIRTARIEYAAHLLTTRACPSTASSSA